MTTSLDSALWIDTTGQFIVGLSHADIAKENFNADVDKLLNEGFIRVHINNEYTNVEFSNINCKTLYSFKNMCIELLRKSDCLMIVVDSPYFKQPITNIETIINFISCIKKKIINCKKCEICRFD